MKFISTLVTQGSGVVGNLVVEKNGVIRNRNSPTNPNSLLQQAVRATLALFAQDWSATLTAPQRAAWNAYATTVVRHDALGKAVKLSGINCYVGGNAALTQAGAATVTDAPVLTGAASLAPINSAVLDDSANTFNISFATAPVTGTHVNLFLSPDSISLGRSKYSGPYRYNSTADTDGTTDLSFTGITLPATGEQWAYRLEGVDAQGRVTQSLSGLTLVVA